MTSRIPCRRRLLPALGAATMLAMAAPAHATLYTYDDGSWNIIRQDRWFAWEASIDGAPVLDSHRSSGSGALTLAATVGGDPLGPTHSGSGHVGLTFVRSRDIRDIRVTITPKAAVASYDCGSSLDVSTVETVVTGSFFNASATARPDSVVGDVRAWVKLRKSSASPLLQLVAGYGRCNDAQCSSANLYPSGSLYLADVAIGSPVTVELRWEPANHRFTVIGGAMSGTLAYTLNDTHPAHQADKRLEIVGRPLGCATGGMAVQATSGFSAILTDVQP